MWHRAIRRLHETPAEAAALWRLVRARYLAAFGIVAAAILLALLDVAFAIYVYLLFLALGAARQKPAVSGAARR